MNRSNTKIWGILFVTALVLAVTSTGASAVESSNVTNGSIWYRANVTLRANLSLDVTTVYAPVQNTTYPEIGNYTKYKTRFMFNHSQAGEVANISHINFTLPDKNIALSKPIALYNSTNDFSAGSNIANLTLLLRNNSEGYQIYTARLWNMSQVGGGVVNATWYNLIGYHNWTITYWLQPISKTSISNESGRGFIEETWHVKNPGNNLTITNANITLTPYQKQWDIKTGINWVKVNNTAYTRNATSDTGFSILLNMSSVYEVIVKYGMTYSTSGSPSSGGGTEPIATITTPIALPSLAIVFVGAMAIIAILVIVVVLVKTGKLK